MIQGLDLNYHYHEIKVFQLSAGSTYLNQDTSPAKINAIIVWQKLWIFTILIYTIWKF